MIGSKPDEIDNRIFRLFSEPRQPSNKAKALGISKSALSHRLKNLRKHNFLAYDQKTRMYTVPLATLNTLNSSKTPTSKAISYISLEFLKLDVLHDV